LAEQFGRRLGGEFRGQRLKRGFTFSPIRKCADQRFPLLDRDGRLCAALGAERAARKLMRRQLNGRLIDQLNGLT
jgi:hypothetical protein